ncbi:MAG: ABC transporter substrate-binding protein [Caulobacterales bacterium]|nr:ABC transporter substrate-binding protein [Caulobacterales bacterium]
MRRRFLAAGLGLAGLSLSGCGDAVKPGQAILKVGSQKGGTKALVLASGVLEGAPYKVEWSEFPAAQHLLEAIGAGAVDLGAVGDAPFLFAYASGSKVRAVHASKGVGEGAGTALLVGKDSPIRTVAELRGRKVATGRGSIGHYLLLALLEGAGLKAVDVETVFLSPGDAKAAFSSGAVDAWVTWGSYIFIATRREGARILADGRGVLNGVGFEVAGIASIAAKRPQIADFLHRLSRAQRWSGDHQDAYAKVLAKETGLDEEIARLTVALNRGIPTPIDATVVAQEQKVLDRFRAAGAITSNPDLAQAFDSSFNAAVGP